jgi:hypothetical protein
MALGVAERSGKLDSQNKHPPLLCRGLPTATLARPYTTDQGRPTVRHWAGQETGPQLLSQNHARSFSWIREIIRRVRAKTM